MSLAEKYFNHEISWRQAKNELSARVLAKGRHNDTWCRAEMFIEYWLDEHFESADDAISALSSIFKSLDPDNLLTEWDILVETGRMCARGEAIPVMRVRVHDMLYLLDSEDFNVPVLVWAQEEVSGISDAAVPEAFFNKIVELLR
nr:MAG TPA: hypothetical protein [Caudoviricetes sp.]